MVENFNNKEIIEFLESIGFLISDGYGPGIPIYLKKGKHIINKFTNLFIDELNKSGFDYEKISISKLTNIADFSKLYRGIHDYSNEVVEYNNKVITSDPLAQTLIRTRSGFVNVLSISPIYREKNKGLIPLFKDKYIYPVVQIDQKLPTADHYINRKHLERLFKNFYKKVGLYFVFLESSEVEQYAEKEIYFLGELNNGFTKLGMIYELSKKFNKNYDVPLTDLLVNSGFSGKTLFLSIKNFSEFYGTLAIPPCLCETLIYIFSRDNSYQKNFNHVLFNYKESCKLGLGDKNFYKKWKRSEAFYYLYQKDNQYVVTEKNGQISYFDSESSLLRYLSENLYKLENKSFEFSKAKLLQNLASRGVMVCEKCETNKEYGVIQDERGFSCSLCGKITRQFHSDKRFY